MRVNNVITKMQAGEKAYGCSLTFTSTAVVELMGQAGLDHVSFDSEHGPFTPESLVQKESHRGKLRGQNRNCACPLGHNGKHRQVAGRAHRW